MHQHQIRPLSFGKIVVELRDGNEPPYKAARSSSYSTSRFPTSVTGESIGGAVPNERTIGVDAGGRRRDSRR